MKLRFTYCERFKNWALALKELEQIYMDHNQRIDAVELVAGDNGVYDVHKDDELVFSKDQEGRFPEEGEIKERIG